MNTALIRDGAPQDLDALVRIYNHYVTSSHVTFDTTPFSTAERQSWMASFSTAGPHRLLVAEVASQTVGYASSKEFRPRAAYSTSVETAVYLDPDFLGQGVGRLLYAALLEVLEQDEGLHRAYAAIALPNPASVALHESLGFRLVGSFRQVGRKFDKFWDVAWYEKDLSCPGP